MESAMAEGPPETGEHDACECRRTQHAGHELEEVRHHHSPESRRHGVGQRQSDADGESDRRVPAQQDAAELHHRQHHPAHDDRILATGALVPARRSCAASRAGVPP